jgi:hypothetical protein
MRNSGSAAVLVTKLPIVIYHLPLRIVTSIAFTTSGPTGNQTQDSCNSKSTAGHFVCYQFPSSNCSVVFEDVGYLRACGEIKPPSPPRDEFKASNTKGTYDKIFAEVTDCQILGMWLMNLLEALPIYGANRLSLRATSPVLLGARLRNNCTTDRTDFV